MLNITFNVYQSMFALRKSGFENLHFEVFDKSYFAYVAKCNKIKVNKLGLLRKETSTDIESEHELDLDKDMVEKLVR